MLRKVLYAKIHMATVNAARPDYNGSIMVPSDYLEATGLRVSDAVLVADCNNAARFETYIIRGEPGSKRFEVNGAAARLVVPGDRVILFHYAWMTDEEYRVHRPRVLVLNEDNTIAQSFRYEPGQ